MLLAAAKSLLVTAFADLGSAHDLAGKCFESGQGPRLLTRLYIQSPGGKSRSHSLFHRVSLKHPPFSIPHRYSSALVVGHKDCRRLLALLRAGTHPGLRLRRPHGTAGPAGGVGSRRPMPRGTGEKPSATGGARCRLCGGEIPIRKLQASYALSLKRSKALSGNRSSYFGKPIDFADFA